MVTTETLHFPGSARTRLSGVLHVPEDPVGSVLLAHCLTCSKNQHTMTRLADVLSGAGYAVLRFDFTGLGESEGDFARTTVATRVSDLTRAAMTLIQRGYGPCGLVGHSFGGAAALLAASKLKSVRSIAVVASPATASHVRHLLVGREDEIRARGSAEVNIGGRPFPISAEFLAELEEYDSGEHIADLGRPLLVVHPLDDGVVPISEGERIFGLARQPKGFLPVMGADHLLTDRTVAVWVANQVVAWLDATRG